jgi:hypothetical protein
MSRDYTKYTVEGLGENLNKRQLVLEIVKDWASKNNPSFDEIQAAFPDEVQGSKGFIVKESEVKDPKRFNMKEPLSIKNGLHVVVSNQWGSKNVDTFLNLVSGLGYKIEKVSKNVSTEKSTNDESSIEFDITKLSLHDFKKLLRDIKDKASFEASLLKQVSRNIDFWSYLLVYDHIINEGSRILSVDNMDEAQDVFLAEWLELGDAEQSLAQFVMDKIDMNFDEVHLNKDQRIHYVASFGSYLYFCMMNFSYEIDAEDMAAFLASNNHSMTRDGKDVFDTHCCGDDWIIDMADEWQRYCGFDPADYEGDYVEVRVINGDYIETSINYISMAEDVIAQFE